LESATCGGRGSLIVGLVGVHFALKEIRPETRSANPVHPRRRRRNNTCPLLASLISSHAPPCLSLTSSPSVSLPSTFSSNPSSHSPHVPLTPSLTLSHTSYHPLSPTRLKTVDEYYSGANNTIQHAWVRGIINSVVLSLTQNPDRQFTYVEQAFFQRWWREQDEPMRAVCRTLVKNGQLTFVNGGWCMHDEAATHFVGEWKRRGRREERTEGEERRGER